MPTGFSRDGIPLGMQIAGRAFDETMVYRIAHAYCVATGFSDKRPPIKIKVREKAATPA